MSEDEFRYDPRQSRLDFGGAPPEPSEEIEASDALVLDLDGFEGPLHVLLALARQQKVDLLKISITRLAEQYLAFVQEARRLRFALAADYLVMASWLAYLKSRLLLPKTERKQNGDEPAPEDLAAALASVSLRPPRVPVWSNVDARPHTDPEEIRQLLVRQVLSPVLWEKTTRALLADGFDKFYEIGPGRVLAGLLKRVQRKTEVENVAA
jgi:chromatin segregation and condensation protein Rec8/ScpA/Scc1 (kleisin family)